ncbi:MAG TPA: helix-turn-helix domain-containing protein [Dermatophilaceae bacterium]
MSQNGVQRHNRNGWWDGESLFVHPNAVRNRVGSLTAATGLDPGDTFAAFDLWWLCQIWSASTPDHQWPAG